MEKFTFVNRGKWGKGFVDAGFQRFPIFTFVNNLHL